MSNQFPGPADGSDPQNPQHQNPQYQNPQYQPGQPGQPMEYLGAEQPAGQPERSGNGRRWALVAGATVAVVGIAGAGAWGVAQFMSGGPAPATAVPADALAYVAVDLDPDGGQKIEALKMMRKFPAIEKELDLGGQDDLRRAIFEAILEDSGCDDVEFGKDIDPWLGGKMGVAAMPGDDGPVPVVVVQVKDEDKAREGVKTLENCGGGGGDSVGLDFVGDYMVLAETDKIAGDAAADAEKASLADDDDFTKWIDEAGGDGIVTAYVAAEGAKAMYESQMQGGDDCLGGDADACVMGRSAALDDGGDLQDYEEFEDDLGLDDNPVMPGGPDDEQITKALEDFQGAAMALRFDDGALELEMAAGGLPSDTESGGDSGLADLPATTAMALGFGVSDTFAEDMMDNLSDVVGEEEMDSMVEDMEAETGLSLPEDLQAVLGDGVSVALDSSVDFDSFFSGNGGDDPEDFPMGVRINGDPDQIVPVLDKIIEAMGGESEGIIVEEGDGAVAVGIAPDYVADLAGDGSLGDEKRFDEALPDMDGAMGGLFIDFDAGDWLTEMADSEPNGDELRENLEPLMSLGISGNVDGDVMHGMVRLSTN